MFIDGEWCAAEGGRTFRPGSAASRNLCASPSVTFSPGQSGRFFAPASTLAFSTSRS